MPGIAFGVQVRRALVLGLVALTVVPLGARAEEDPVVDDSRSSRRLQALPRRAGPKPVVALSEVRSAVPGLAGAAAQDMLTTALVKSGAFVVVERSRMEGVMRERQLNASGLTTGASAQVKPTAAGYVLEVVVSEVNAGEKQGASAFEVAGMQVNTASTRDSIGLDLRIVNVETGVVQDAVNVRKVLEASQSEVRGVGQAASAVAGLFGKKIPVSADIGSSGARKESVDKALRACMETAVHELAKRLQEE